jgi:glutamyl/glutaminyl-tRNA synthetase
VGGDFGSYKQSNRKHLYKQYSDELLAKGCAYIVFDTTEENYRKRYYKGELPRKQTFESLVLSTDPKFVQKRWQTAHGQDYANNASTSVKENTTKSENMSTFVNRFGQKLTPVSTLENTNQ